MNMYMNMMHCIQILVHHLYICITLYDLENQMT